MAELVTANPSLVDVRQSGYSYERPLLLAAKNGHAKVVEWLLDKGAVIDPKKDTSALKAAAGSGQLEVVKLLLARGADINRKSSIGTTALHSAAAEGRLDVVKFLISRVLRFWQEMFARTPRCTRPHAKGALTWRAP